jgi:hypothetical protein
VAGNGLQKTGQLHGAKRPDRRDFVDMLRDLDLPSHLIDERVTPQQRLKIGPSPVNPKPGLTPDREE